MLDLGALLAMSQRRKTQVHSCNDLYKVFYFIPFFVIHLLISVNLSLAFVYGIIHQRSISDLLPWYSVSPIVTFLYHLSIAHCSEAFYM